MSQVWENGPDQQAERFVLLALADFANDAGECWPSIKAICGKVCMSERGVQTVIRRLESSGWLAIETGNGRKGCSKYAIMATKVRVAVEEKDRRGGIDRLAIFKRDDFTCVYCGYVGISFGQEVGADLHVDHVVPVSRGGSSDPENLVCSCAKCNTSKKDKTPSEWARNPAGNAPRRKCTPHMDAETPHMDVKNPAGNAPEPSRTIKNHQIYRSTPEKPTTQKKPTRQSAFDEFWSAYPMKVGKVAARRNFDRAVKSGADQGEIIAGAKRYASSENVRRGYIKHPQGWLTDGRWADEAQPPIPQQSEATNDRQSFLRKIAGASP